MLENKCGHANNPATIVDYFQQLIIIIKKYNISQQLIFNVDKKGFLKNYAEDGKIIIPKEHKNIKFTLHDDSRESIIMIESVGVGDTLLSPMVIFSAKSYLLSWHRNHEARTSE